MQVPLEATVEPIPGERPFHPGGSHLSEPVRIVGGRTSALTTVPPTLSAAVAARRLMLRLHPGRTRIVYALVFADTVNFSVVVSAD